MIGSTRYRQRETAAPMLFRGLSLASCFLLAAQAVPARAAECPFEPLEREKIVAAIAGAATCPAAFDVMNSCLTVAGGDVELANTVIDKCEATFLGGLDAKTKAAYQKERTSCVKKYEGEQGTMYVSFTVTCEAKVAVRYARKWGKGAQAK